MPKNTHGHHKKGNHRWLLSTFNFLANRDTTVTTPKNRFTMSLNWKRPMCAMVSRKNFSQFYCRKPCLYKKPKILSTAVAVQQFSEGKRIKSNQSQNHHIMVNKFYFQKNFRTDKKVNILKRILKHLYSKYIYKDSY